MIDPGALIDGASLAITGATGTLGNALVAELMNHYWPRRVVLFSRSESRQAAMRERWPETVAGPLRYVVGDVRDKARLVEAFTGVDIVIHGAALKRVEVCASEPVEAVLTNVLGTLNSCQAARQCGVRRFMFVSSDKATAAATLYGGTKYVAERMVVGFNRYACDRQAAYSAVRYGNVLGSTGSAAQAFQAAGKTVPITDPRCTRFFITARQAARFVLSSLALMRGGEVFVPKLPAADVLTLARAFATDVPTEIVGMRGFEKVAEAMISADEAPWTVDIGDRYALLPALPFWAGVTWPGAKAVPAGFSYTSENEPRRLTADELRGMVG